MSSTSTKPPTVAIRGYYAVRKGKGGLRDCIFVSWDRAKEYCDVSGSGDGGGDRIEFSFFAKFEDAIQYIHPNATSKKNYYNSAGEDGGAITTTTPPASDTEKKSSSSSPGTSTNKRKRLGVAEDAKAVVKKSRLPTQGSNDNKEKNQDEPKKMEDDKSESPKDSNDVDTNEDKDNDDESHATEIEDDPSEHVVEAEPIPASPDSKEGGDDDDDAVASLTSSASLNILLEQGFQQNLPKGWRSQHLGLFLNRRDHFKEPALKQYLQDLKDLQNYRESTSQPPRSSEEKHVSGASHPISVFYLNWAWGVCNSYHRDIRRQQKKNNAPHQPYSSQLDGVELPHFKAHTTKNTAASTTSDNNNNNNNNNNKAANTTKPTNKKANGPNALKTTASKPTDSDSNAATATTQGGGATTEEENKQEQPSSSSTSTATTIKPKALAEILADGYTNVRQRGWRARDILPKPQDEDCDDEEEADIHKTYVQQLKRKHYTKELKKLELFRDSSSSKELLERYSKDKQPSHPSGIASPFEVEYLRYAWDIKDEDLMLIDNIKNAGASEQPRPSRRTLPTQAHHSNSTAAAAVGGVKPSGEVPSATVVAAEADAVNSASFASGGVDISEDDETPQLIEALRASWFKGRDKGWRSVEMGLQVDPRSKTLTMTARKKREQLYIHDLEVLKQWWKTYPSSQHYIFTVPEEGQEEATYKNLSYAASSTSSGSSSKGSGGSKSDQKRHKSGINAPWSLTYLNWSWGVSNSYNRDLVRKEKRKASYQKQVAQSKEEQQQAEQNQAPLYI